MTTEDEAREALLSLLWELPAEFSDTDVSNPRPKFSVIKKSNVRRVHQSLITLQRYFELLEEEE